MADKIAKFLRRLSQSDQVLMLELIQQIIAGDAEGLDDKPLKNHHTLRRVRHGDFRIVYQVLPNQKRVIIHVGRRSEKTYRDL